MNKLWDGDGVGNELADEDRAFDFPHAKLTVSLAVQESVLRDYYTKATTAARGSGFLARFLITAPKSLKGTRLETQESLKHTESGVMHSYDVAIKSLFDRQYEIATNSSIVGLPVMQFDEAAKLVWLDYFNESEAGQGEGGEFEEEGDFASKSPAQACRLAGSFHLINGNSHLDLISADTMKRACRVAGFYLYEAKRFFSGGLSSQEKDAIALEQWVIGKCRENGTNRLSYWF